MGDQLLYLEGNQGVHRKRRHRKRWGYGPLYFEGKAVVLERKTVVLRRKEYCTSREITLYFKGKAFVPHGKKTALTDI